MDIYKDSVQKDIELVNLKNGIISKISHEYRTPLTVIQTSTDLLKIYYEIRDKDKFDECIRKINSSIEKMVKFLEDIVLFGQIESKMVELNIEKVDIISFVDSIISHLRQNKTGIQEITFVNTGEFRIYATDLNLINIIVTRILSNAIIYSDKNIKIKIELNTFIDKFILSVYYLGDYIEPEKLKEIFNPFSQIIPSDLSAGIEFGLVIVRESAALLNGTIEVNSKIETGTCITVTIPDKS